MLRDSESSMIERYVKKPLFNIIDRYCTKPVAKILKRILTEIGIRSTVKRFIAAVSAAALNLDSFAIGAAISQASPYCNVLPDEKLLAEIDKAFRKKILTVDVVQECNDRFGFAYQNLMTNQIAREEAKTMIDDIQCEENEIFMTKGKYLKCIICLITLLLNLCEASPAAASMLMMRVLQLVQSGRMSKQVGMLIYQILMRRGIKTPYYKLPKVPKIKPY